MCGNIGRQALFAVDVMKRTGFDRVSFTWVSPKGADTESLQTAVEAAAEAMVPPSVLVTVEAMKGYIVVRLLSLTLQKKGW